MKRNLLLYFILFAFCLHGYAQSYQLLNSFTTNEGLPSNHIYNVVEDRYGFLWIATDNGVSRFDGKYFKNYTLRDGLPSNDVIQLIIDGSGTLWANCFKQLPRYFDEQSHRFVSMKNEARIAPFESNLLLSYSLPNGSIRFHNVLGYFQCKEGKLESVNRNSDLSLMLIGQQGNPVHIHTDINTLNHNRIWFNQTVIDSFVNNFERPHRPFISHNYFYYSPNAKTVIRYQLINGSPIQVKRDTLTFNTACNTITSQNGHLIIQTDDGKLSLYNEQSLTLQSQMIPNNHANYHYVDRKNHLWISTLDQGLLMYASNGIERITLANRDKNENFISVALDKKGILYAGNYSGELIEKREQQTILHTLSLTPKILWTREIECAYNKILTLCDMGFSINLNPYIPFDNKRNRSYVSAKCATILNDSIALVGSLNGMLRLNLYSKTYQILFFQQKRISSIARVNEHLAYYICSDGLYKYEETTRTSTKINVDVKVKKEVMNKVVYASDNSLWISTNSGSLMVLKQEQLIPNGIIHSELPENITCMLVNQNKVWIGSKSGITVLNYSLTPSFSYSVTNISKCDGLPSNSISDIAYQHPYIYAASDHGLVRIPQHFHSSSNPITLHLSAVRINQKQVPVSRSYALKQQEKNIELEFVGIELGGHFNLIEFKIDDQANWSKSESNTLNLQLNDGAHSLRVRALDVNHVASSNELQLSFTVASPLYKKNLFWIVVSVIITILILSVVHWRKRERQRIGFNQQLALEKQRQKITADLHDDIGASLSSLQINSAVANQLMERDPIKAQQVLEKIELQAENLAEKIGDIIWSMKPGKDEFMTISNRIRTFANDILGSTGIDYHIRIDPVLDKMIQDIFLRKNVVLIIKEALNNCVKYSHASKVQIILRVKDATLSIEIIDNGIGFDPSLKKGNGLDNMKKRTEELGGTFTLISKPDHGTSINAEIPITLTNT